MKQLYIIIFSILLLSPAISNGQIVAGQIDDFESGLQNWERGMVVDGKLELTADAAGPNGKLVTFNQAQWSGNYLEEEITHIRFTITNPSTENLSMRIALGTGENANSGTWYASSDSISVNAGATDQILKFPLSTETMSLITGSEEFQSVFQSVFTLRILHSETPSATGTPISAIITIDNIEAIAETTSIIGLNSQQFSFYPNPASHNLTIISENGNNINIYDLTGKHYKTLYVFSGRNHIDINNWIPGMYILRTQANEGTISKRLIIE